MNINQPGPKRRLGILGIVQRALESNVALRTVSTSRGIFGGLLTNRRHIIQKMLGHPSKTPTGLYRAMSSKHCALLLRMAKFMSTWNQSVFDFLTDFRNPKMANYHHVCSG